MELVWSNAQYFNGADSEVGVLAGALARKFKKETVAVTSRYGTWLQKIDMLFQRLNRLIAAPPRSLEEHLGHSEFQSPLPSRELGKLAKAAAFLNHQNDMVRFIQLMTTLSVPFLIDQDQVKIETKDVTPFAAKQLIAFAKERLGTMGLAYPR
jgi:hypothetical protein